MIFIFQALRLGHVSFIKTTTGQIVNLVTNDIQRLEWVMKTSDLTYLLKRDRRDIRENQSYDFEKSDQNTKRAFHQGVVKPK